MIVKIINYMLIISYKLQQLFLVENMAAVHSQSRLQKNY